MTQGRQGRVDAAAHLAELELVEDGRLTGGVEADHEDAHLLLAQELLPDLAERETHGERCGGLRRPRGHKKVDGDELITTVR